MSRPTRRIGVNCALSTPFAEDGSIDLARLIAHGRWVLETGADGLTLFGTTGEGAGIGLGERHAALGAFAGSGLDMGARVVAGVISPTVEGAVEQARTAYAFGCRAVLMTPPFFFPDMSEEGLFSWFASVFERLGGGLRDVILYHIPGMTRVDITPALLVRLADAFGDAVIGIKDSSGDWETTAAFLDRRGDLQILVGNERHVAAAVRAGGGGTICGLANVRPDLLRLAAWEGQDVPAIGPWCEAITAEPFIQSVKALVAHRTGDAGWNRVRPPNAALGDARIRALLARIADIERHAAA